MTYVGGLYVIIQGKKTKLIIDGGTEPNTDSRFCLGQISNHKRTIDVERCRNCIGNGIELIKNAETTTGLKSF